MQVVKDIDALVVLSGGLDSTVALFIAARDWGINRVGAVSFNYGQRHAREIESARAVMEVIGASDKHLVFEGLAFPSSMLTDKSVEIPNKSYSEIEGVSPTYVPYRNGTLLSLAASIAMASGAKAIYAGQHAEDAQNWAYPDCTPEFLGAMANAIHVGTYFKTRLHTPLMWLMKHEIVSVGVRLQVPFELTWSCYAGEELHCGTCMTCRARKDAFDKARVVDPTVYAY